MLTLPKTNFNFLSVNPEDKYHLFRSLEDFSFEGPTFLSLNNTEEPELYRERSYLHNLVDVYIGDKNQVPSFVEDHGVLILTGQTNQDLPPNRIVTPKEVQTAGLSDLFLIHPSLSFVNVIVSSIPPNIYFSIMRQSPLSKDSLSEFLDQMIDHYSKYRHPLTIVFPAKNSMQVRFGKHRLIAVGYGRCERIQS